MHVTLDHNTYLLLFLLQGELLLLDDLQLVAEVEFGRLLLQLGEFVLVLGHLLERGLDAVFCYGRTDKLYALINDIELCSLC